MYIIKRDREDLRNICILIENLPVYKFRLYGYESMEFKLCYHIYIIIHLSY